MMTGACRNQMTRNTAIIGDHRCDQRAATPIGKLRCMVQVTISHKTGHRAEGFLRV